MTGRIMVIDGASRGLVGVVVGASKYGPWLDGEPMWCVRLDGEVRDSHLRESFLAPEPERSDEDVLGPLRRVRCP